MASDGWEVRHKHKEVDEIAEKDGGQRLQPVAMHDDWSAQVAVGLLCHAPNPNTALVGDPGCHPAKRKGSARRGPWFSPNAS